MKNKEWISNIGTVVFNGNKYSTRTINVKGYGEWKIAGVSLVNELRKNDKYVSETAKLIDDYIDFYVEDKWLNCGDKQLEKTVLRKLN